jgi:hypothetical protein
MISQGPEHTDGWLIAVPLSDTSYKAPCSDNWLAPIRDLTKSGTHKKVYDKVFPMTDPEAGYFQHFLDSGLKKVCLAAVYCLRVVPLLCATMLHIRHPAHSSMLAR